MKKIFKNLQEMFISFEKSILFKLILILLAFLTGFGPFNLTGMFLTTMIAISFGTFLISNKIVISRNFITIVIFSTFFTTFSTLWNYVNGNQITFSSFILFFIAPPTLYLLGYCLIYKNKNFKFALFIFIAWLFGMFFRGFASVILNITLNGFNFSERRYLEIWTQEFTNSTLLTTFLNPLASIFLIYIFIKNKKSNKFILMFLGFVFVVTIYALSMYGVRSSFVNFVLLVFFLSLYVLKSASEKIRKIFFYSFIILSLLLVLFVIAVYFNLFNIQKIVIKIPVLFRFFEGGSNNERLKLYENFFKNFVFYPFGNLGQSKTLEISYYVHNVWFDIYSFGGILSFVPFVLITVRFFINMFTFFKEKNKDAYTLILFFSAISLYQIYLFEPVIQGNTYLFLLQFLIYGIIDSNAYNLSNKNLINTHFGKNKKHSTWNIVDSSDFTPMVLNSQTIFFSELSNLTLKNIFILFVKRVSVVIIINDKKHRFKKLLTWLFLSENKTIYFYSRMIEPRKTSSERFFQIDKIKITTCDAINTLIDFNGFPFNVENVVRKNVNILKMSFVMQSDNINKNDLDYYKIKL